MMTETIEIRGIDSFYGGLVVKKENGRFYWGIWNHSGIDFEEIPESLYLELLKHHHSED